MSKEKYHIDDQFIPEGLEFREEYMHAALNGYKRAKRMIAFKRASFVLSVILLITGASIAWLDDSSNQSTVLTNGVTKEKTTTNRADNSEMQLPDSNEEASSPYDLGEDEQGLYKNGQSPAIESSEPTQDQSTKAVDLGGSMSSGVELPGQLSTPKAGRKTSDFESKHDRGISNALVHGFTDSNDPSIQAPSHHMAPQVSDVSEGPADSAILQEIAYRPLQLFTLEHPLATAKPMELPRLPKWHVYALVGLNAWSDFAFHHSPYKLDGTAALGVGYKVNNQVSAEVNAHIYSVSGNASPYVAIQRQYGAGFNETTYRYYTNRLYQTGLAALFKYNISRRHSMSAGWCADYLLTADNRIESGTASSYENPISSSTNEKGYVQGYRTLQHALLLNYEFVLGRNKSVGAQYQWGLTDITKNEFFGNASDKNSMLSFYFRLKLKS